jgi:phage-related protein
MKTIGVVLGSLAIGKLIKDSMKMAMGVETAIENINHNMGQAAKAFQDWVETQSKSLGMAKADAYNYGSIFSNLLSSFTSSAKETAEQTQELMKAAAIIASRTGRTYEDVANRIRSGMLGSTEAIEDLGVYTNISVLQSTEAFRRLAGDKSWAQLDFRTQQQIRLAAILEQTYKRYGDTLADTTQTRQAQFVASLKNIQLFLGQAFLPIYNAVLPALTTMANAIGRVVNLIAQFTTALFGAPKQAQAQATAIQSQASAMENLGAATAGTGKAAKKAAKEAKGALAGFDEINQLSKQAQADAGGGGAAGGGIGTIGAPALDTGGFASATVEVSEKIQKMANDIKKAFKRIASTIKNHKKDIITSLAGIGSAIGTYLIGKHWDKIIMLVTKAKGAIVPALTSINVPLLGVSALIGLVVAAIVDLWQTNEEFRQKVIQAWNGIKDTLKNIWNSILKPIFQAFIDMLLDIWNNGLKPLWDKWKEFVKQVVLLMADLWDGMKPIVDWVVKTFGPAIVEVFKYVFDMIKNTVMLIINVVSSLISAFSGVVNGIRQIFQGLIDFLIGVFTGDWRRAWDGIKQIFSGVGTAISSIWNGIKGVFGAILSYVGNTFRTTWESAWNIIKSVTINIWNGLSSWLSTLWNNLKNTAANIFNNLKNAIVNAFNSIKSSTSSIWNSIWSIIKGVLNWIIGGMNKMINALNNIKITVPAVNIPLVGKVGGFSIGLPRIPNIPYLAQGGIITSPTLAVVGEAGAEAVIPLERDSAVLDKLVNRIMERLNALPLGGGDIIIQIGGEEVGRIAMEQIKRAQRQAGKTLIPV